MTESRFAEAFAKEPETAPIVEARRESIADLPLIDFVQRLSPEHARPDHLAEWCGLLDDAAEGKPVRGLCAEPIRHWKSTTTMHGVIKILLRDPSTPIIHLSHSFEKAQAVGKKIRQLAESCDQAFGTHIGPDRGTNTIQDWRNTAGGGVVVMSGDMSKLGYDCGCLIADDPVDEHGANDPKVREAVDEALAHYTARCMRRGKPGPVLIVASRWHVDDPIGRRMLRTAREWVYVSHSAIVDEGLPTERAFAENVWSLAELKAMREELREKDPTERIWWAQLMNDPKPIGSDLFREPTYYPSLPPWTFRMAHGADLAFTSGASSDFFAMASGKVMGTKLYVLEIQRHKLDAHMIESTAKAMLERHGTGPIYSYMSGPEIGMARLMRERGLPFQPLPARYNKLVRAQRTIKRWNDGDIALPKDAPWLKGVLHRVSCFRGNDHDEGDDEVDALVSLADGAMGGAAAGGGPRLLGSSYPGMNTDGGMRRF